MATDGLADPLLLEKINKLFACGVGHQVSLPQIVVVGDQSSGKSSVLEGLVRKAFPRASGLCTRFATQIIFRRADEESIKVSIIPDKDATAEERAHLESWSKTPASLDTQEFVSIMEEVHELLGLRPAGVIDERPTFSNSVLCLEFSGPDEEHLSVIDVPGIFKSTMAGQTKKSDIPLVRNMVPKYMKNPRSVMLAVLPAPQDPATQEILEMAKEVDAEGTRTLGVLTKPDLVDKGAESTIMDILNGKSYKMKLGWHIVRNLGQIELSGAGIDRDTLEREFFATRVPWNQLSDDQIGIEMLRHRLKEVLTELVKAEFPEVRAEILKQLAIVQKRLSDLGS